MRKRKKYIHFASYYRWLVAKLYWKLPMEFDQPVLDVGADDGFFLSQICAPMKIAVDIAPKQRLDFPLIQSNAKKLPFSDGVFGHIFIFDVIEHIQDDHAVLFEAERLLAADGILWISTTAEDFRIFPGGRIQSTFEKGWGHVRQGYSIELLRSLIPDNMFASFYVWNEPYFRFFYLLLKILYIFYPPLALSCVERLVAIDACHQDGKSGHLFVRASRSSILI